MAIRRRLTQRAFALYPVDESQALNLRDVNLPRPSGTTYPPLVYPLCASATLGMNKISIANYYSHSGVQHAQDCRHRYHNPGIWKSSLNMLFISQNYGLSKMGYLYAKWRLPTTPRECFPANHNLGVVLKQLKAHSSSNQGNLHLPTRC